MKTRHIPPKYHGYKSRTYADVGLCLKCGHTSLRQDFHPANPCPTCGAGNKDREWFAARWVYGTLLNWLMRRGYWERAK